MRVPSLTWPQNLLTSLILPHQESTSREHPPQHNPTTEKSGLGVIHPGFCTSSKDRSKHGSYGHTNEVAAHPHAYRQRASNSKVSTASRSDKPNQHCNTITVATTRGGCRGWCGPVGDRPVAGCRTRRGGGDVGCVEAWLAPSVQSRGGRGRSVACRGGAAGRTVVEQAVDLAVLHGKTRYR